MTPDDGDRWYVDVSFDTSLDASLDASFDASFDVSAGAAGWMIVGTAMLVIAMTEMKNNTPSQRGHSSRHGPLRQHRTQLVLHLMLHGDIMMPMKILHDAA